MAGNQEYEYSSEAYPTPQGSARVLLDAAHRGLLIHGTNWAQYEPIIPGATQAGMFVEVVKKAKQLKAGQGYVFTLAKMIWYEAAGLLPKTLDQTFSGEARAILLALVGGQLYTTAVIQDEVPEAIGDLYLDQPASDPSSLSQLFALSYVIPTQLLYNGGPPEYHDFQVRLREMGPFFSEEELQHAGQTAEVESPSRKSDQYGIASRVLLEIFIGRLQNQVQKEIEHAPPKLPSDCRRLISDK